MNIEIKGKLLRTLYHLSQKKKVSVEDLCRDLIQIGLDAPEVEKIEAQREADEFIEANWQKMSDAEMAGRLASLFRPWRTQSIRLRRQVLGLDRLRNFDAADLGTEAEIREALINGGKTIRGLAFEIFHKKKILISREGLRQILLKKYGLTGTPRQRTSL